MAARSIASLTISFGMVSIPVKVYSATEASKAISFNLLHKACGSRLKQQYLCVKEEVVVPREDMVKGYEFAKDQYVMFSPEELKAMEEVGTHSAEITEFVPLKTVDPVYFDKAYYLGPDKGGAKPYALLARALSESGRCALGRWAARGKQYIVMIRPVEDLVEGLVMQQLLYAGEVRSFRDIDVPKMDVKPAELKLAQQLIEQQSSEKFDPAAYKDEVRERIEAAVQKKVEGQEITLAEEPAGGPRKAWLFSFQDLIVLRTAQALAAAKVPRKRITRSVKELRRHLPQSMPLSGLSICAVADRVVVKEGHSRWQAESGQYLLAFEGDPVDGSLSVIESKVAEPAPSAADCFDRGVALESKDAEAALRAYEQAIAEDPTLLDAHINLGSLLHETGRFAKAERVYRDAIKASGSDPVLLYNLGVLLEDMRRKTEAMQAYEAALRGNPGFADCHYNLALLCEELRKPKEAIRHMAQYRRLIASKS